MERLFGANRLQYTRVDSMEDAGAENVKHYKLRLHVSLCSEA